ncbi:MAG: phosphotransferase [Acidimicrobiales bacterium]
MATRRMTRWERGRGGRRFEPLAVTSWALMANTVATSALGVVFWAAASRLYSPQQLGEDAALVSAMILLSTVSQLNLSMGITRLLPQVQQSRWRPVVGAYALTAIVGSVLTAGFLTLAPRLSAGFAFLAQNPTLGLALLGAVVLWNIFALQDAVLTSARWAAAIPVENGLFGLLKIGVMIWLAHGLISHGVFFAWLLAMALLLVPVNGLIFGRVLPGTGNRERSAPTVVPLDKRAVVARYLATDYVAALLSQGSSALLPLLVIAVLGRADSAYFYVAFLIAGAIGALAQSLSISLVVEGAYDETNLVSLARRSAARYLRFIAPAVIVLILATPLVLRPFGAAYVAHGTTLLRLLLAGTVAKAVVILYLGVERVRARVSRVLAAEAATLVLVSAGAILGMNLYGLAGVGMGWLVAQLSVAAVVTPRLWGIIGGANRGFGIGAGRGGGAGSRLDGATASSWRSLEAHLDRGAALEDAARAAGCSRAEMLRLTSAASGAWSDLLDDVRDARVLVIEEAPSQAARRLADRGAIIGLADDDPDRLATRRRLCGGGQGVSAGPTLLLLREKWDVVCLNGVRLDRALLRSAVAALAPGARLVVVADNRWSPIRIANRAVGLSVRASATRLHRLSRMLAREGLAHSRVYGLLRSSTAPTSSFAIDSPSAGAGVLLAAASDFGRLRLAALGLVTRLVRVGWSSPLMPAWAVVARAEPVAVGLPVVGRIGYGWTRGARIIYGEPPQELEKHYETAEEGDAEAMALITLRRVGLEIGPRLLSRPSAQVSRMTWCPGRSLSVKPLSQAQRRRWVTASATLLRDMQEATRRPDGSVLVHGDYWLGNLLIDDGIIAAVIDWGSARWGSPTVDATFLVESLGEHCRLKPADIEDLRACRDLAFSFAVGSVQAG